MTPEELMRGVDLSRLMKLPEKYPHLGAMSALKWCDWRQYAGHALGNAQRLGLLDCEPKRILDIGCGFGYFIRACNLHGHDATGVDWPARPAAECYQEAVQIMGVNVHWHVITVQHILPSELSEYDLITVHSLGLPAGPSEGKDEKRPWWRYAAMIEEVITRMKPGGTIDNSVHYDRVPWLANRRRWNALIGDRGRVTCNHNLVTVRLNDD